MTDYTIYAHVSGYGLMAFVVLYAINETFDLIDVGAFVTMLAGIAALVVLGWLLLNLGKLVDVDSMAPRKPH